MKGDPSPSTSFTVPAAAAAAGSWQGTPGARPSAHFCSGAGPPAGGHPTIALAAGQPRADLGGNRHVPSPRAGQGSGAPPSSASVPTSRLSPACQASISAPQAKVLVTSLTPEGFRARPSRSVAVAPSDVL